MKKKNSVTRTITQIAVFSALSIVLYMFAKFSLPMLFPAWLDIQISDMPALLAGFMMGPWQGVAVLVIRTVVKLPFTTTAGVGEVADLVCGAAFVLVAAYVYKHRRTIGGAVLSLVLGCIATTAMSMLANWLVLVPYYVQMFFKGEWGTIVGILQSIFPDATKETFYQFYIFGSVVPFNILRSVLCAAITFLLYKRLVKLFDLIFKTKSVEDDGAEKKVKKAEMKAKTKKRAPKYINLVIDGRLYCVDVNELEQNEKGEKVLHLGKYDLIIP